MIHLFPSMLLSNNDTHSFPFLYELPNESKGKIPKIEVNDYFYEMS